MKSVTDLPKLPVASLSEEIKMMEAYLKEDYSLSELYEEEEDSVEEHVVMGVATPIGSKSDGSRATDAQRKERERKANIYAEEVRKLQAWSLKSLGRIK